MSAIGTHAVALAPTFVVLMTVGALVMLVVAIPTLVRRAALLLRGDGALARRHGAAHLGRSLSRARRAAIAVEVQTVYISNHTSTLDVFLLIALGAAADALLPQRLPREAAADRHHRQR